MNYLAVGDYWFGDVPGGSARVAWDIARLMRTRGHRVVLVCGKPPGHDLDSLSEAEGVEIVRFDRPTLPRWDPRRASGTVRQVADAVVRSVGREGWDLVHIHAPLPGAGVWRAVGDRARYAYSVYSPVVLEQRINWQGEGVSGVVKRIFGERVLARLEGRLLERSAVIHVLSRYMAEQLARRQGIRTRVRVIPHYCNRRVVPRLNKRDARARLGWPADGRILFTVRRHGRRHGLDIAIRAVAGLRTAERLVFYVGGDGVLRAKLEALTTSLGAHDRIVFTGRLSDEDLSLAYQAADIFLLPSTALECFGLIIHEALLHGCPVVSSDVGAIPELMRPILPQFMVPSGDVGALRAKLSDVLEGRLVPPVPDVLSGYVSTTFSEGRIGGAIGGMLEAASDSGSTAFSSGSPA